MASAFDDLADPALWKQAGVVAGGYMGASLAQNFGDDMLPWDLPNEVYGVGVAFVGYRYSPMRPKSAAAGGALYTLDALSQRVGLKESVTALGGN